MTDRDSTPLLDRRLSLPPAVPPEHSSPWYGIVGGIAIVIALVIAHEYGVTEPAGESLQHWFSAMLPEWPLGVRLGAAAVSLVAGLLAALVVHEAGHVLAGFCVGFRFDSMRVGRLHLTRPFRLSWGRALGQGQAGAASMFPVGTHRLRLRAFGMLAGGGAASLIGAGLAAFWLDNGGSSGTFVFCSVLIGTINLVPFRNGTFVSDGRRMVTLVSQPAEAQRWLAMLALTAELNSGVEPESLSPDSLAMATAVRDESFETVIAHLLAYLIRFYQHDDAAAAEALEICLSNAGHVPDAVRQSLMGEAATFQARRRGRADLAEAWQRDVTREMAAPGIDNLQIVAAVLEAKGDVAGARRALDEAERLLVQRPELPLHAVSLRLLRRWRAELGET